MAMFEIPDAAPAASSLDDTARELVSEIPEPQQHAIDQARTEQALDPAQPPPTVETDVLGVPWNPAEHATGQDGKGVRTAKGSWRKRRGLKGSQSHVATDAAGRVPEPSQEEINKRSAEHQSRMAGAVVGTLVIRISTAVGGDHFSSRTHSVPNTDIKWTDQGMLQEAFGDFFVAKGVTDVPPGVALTGALMMYYLPRFQEPAVRERAGGIIHWTKERVARIAHWFKYRRSGGKKPNGSAGQPKPVSPSDPEAAQDGL
jgi:hypothetical protein